MNLIETLNWRYATKRMTDTKVAAEKINEITEAVRLSASSAGLQPYKIIVIKNQEIKTKLQAASFNPQVLESSHLIVFAAFESITASHIDEYINRTAKVRGVTSESLEAFKVKLSSNLLSLSPENAFHWASKQAYIALGTGLIAAANLKVDATPMEGFNAMEFDEILGLKEKGLKSVVLLALGYRDETNDFLIKLKKVRTPMEEFATAIA
jgi:nitroreductase/dihydropteridine reductase